MLKPNNTWKWYYDKKLQSLMLDLGQEMVFRVTIAKKNLVPDAFLENQFSTDDIAVFQIYWDGISDLDLSSSLKAELALNAVAAQRFHKPFLPKSWFFQQQQQMISAEKGTIVALATQTGIGQFLLIENSGTASLCMLAQENSLELNDDRTMHFCEAIKVMNDRLFIAEKKSQNPLAMVG